MITVILAVILSIGLFCTAWSIFQVRRTLRQLIESQEQQRRIPVGYQDLTRQMDEINQTMGGMVNTLQSMGNQVSHLNMLAGYALEGHEHQEEEQSPQIMIEIRRPHRDSESTADDRRMMLPEDMPPEMLEKLRTFQAVYMAVMGNPECPSRKRPDLN